MDPGVKAVVSSGYADNPIVSEYRSYGFVDLLRKPYNVVELRKCLKAP